MCGLVGIAGKLEYKDEDVMRRLLYLDYWRGKDSTGLGAVRGNKQMMVAKAAVHPLDLFDMNRFKSALSGYNSVAFIGHNRAATKGNVNATNAHPFLAGSVLGAHNGTLTRASHKALEDILGETFEVDSEALITAISKLGVKDTIEMCEEGGSYTDGAWALTWYDAADNTLNFLRNKHRPFWYAYSEKYDKIFWASEYWMIESALRGTTFDLAVIKEKDKSYRFFSTEVDVHYKFELDALKAGSKSRPKPKAATIKGKEVKSYTAGSWYGQGNDPFDRDQKSGSTTSGQGDTSKSALSSTTSLGTSRGMSKTSSMVKVKDPDPYKDTIIFAGDKDNPFAGLLDEEKFNQLAQYGCSHCMADVFWGEVGITIYERDGAILCPKCSSIDEGKQQNRVFVRNIREFNN